MRNKLFNFLIVLCLSSCQPDFDPQKDSTMCSVSFDLDCRNCFRNVGSYNDTYYVLMPDSLSPNYFLRVWGFCYDSNNKLVRKKECLYDSIGVIPFTMDYVDSLCFYNFCFVADFVRSDSLLSNIGAWYVSNEDNFETLFAHFASPDSLLQYNTLLYATCSQKPNSPISLSLHPLTYAGYVCFTNISKFKKISYRFSQPLSFSLYQPYNATAYYWGGINEYYPSLATMSAISVPITMFESASRLSIKVETCYVNNSDGDSATYRVITTKKLPFLITVDCADLKRNPTIKFFE